MIGNAYSHRGRSLLIAMPAINSGEPQGPMRTLEIVIEELQAHQRIKGGIAFGESVRLVSQSRQPIAQDPVEPFDMDGACWLHPGPKRGTDFHYSSRPHSL